MRSHVNLFLGMQVHFLKITNDFNWDKCSDSIRRLRMKFSGKAKAKLTAWMNRTKPQPVKWFFLKYKFSHSTIERVRFQSLTFRILHAVSNWWIISLNIQRNEFEKEENGTKPTWNGMFDVATKANHSAEFFSSLLFVHLLMIYVRVAVCYWNSFPKSYLYFLIQSENEIDMFLLHFESTVWKDE